MPYLKVRYIIILIKNSWYEEVGGRWAKREEKEKKESKQRNRDIDLPEDAPTSRT